MRLKLASVVAAMAVVLTACGPDLFTEADLKRLVLQKPDAPAGTAYIDASSGYRNLNEYAKNDVQKRVALQDAGFVSSYFSFFLSHNFYDQSGTISSGGSLADSFALLFKTPDGASKGLAVVEQAVRRDGSGLLDRPAEGLGEESFGLRGTLQAGYPPGFIYAWRVGNAVFGLIAAGAENNINENAVRALADRMRAKLG